ncbi:hypothetical protein [uncultured Methanomethylovorans sp.]|uniref:hypothetical protein n=1 Tax=uncultured Methanomethylovorans sp. TaxID=183759 RepID=UPI002AA745F5|nr:hypothetical protein [uncultured Methanomethylovorans sp.]
MDKAKGIVILVLFLIFTFPPLLKATLWTQNSINNPNENALNELPTIIIDNTLPWWLDIIVYLAGLGTLGAFLIVGFMFFLKWAEQV